MKDMERKRLLVVARMLRDAFERHVAEYLPDDREARKDMITQGLREGLRWVIVARDDWPYVIIRQPTMHHDSDRPVLRTKFIDLREWDHDKFDLSEGLKVDGTEVPAYVKPAIRDAYEAWRKAQRGPQ